MCLSDTFHPDIRPRGAGHHGSAVRMPAGPPLVLMVPTFCKERPPNPEKRTTVISSSTMHCTSSVLLLEDQAMPWHHLPIASSPDLVSCVPLRAHTWSRPLVLKNGEVAGLLVPFMTVTATNLPSGDILMPSGVCPTA